MTREERTKLIKHLKYNRSIGADYLITDKDADEIIKALEQDFILDKIRTEIRAESKKNYTNDIFNKGLYRAIEIIDKYKVGDTD